MGAGGVTAPLDGQQQPGSVPVSPHPRATTTTGGAWRFSTIWQHSLFRLHELGYVFLDVSPHSVLIDEGDLPWLIDFEGVRHIRSVRAPLGTPGFLPPDAQAVGRSDPRELDRYGLASLALYLLFPALDVVDRYPGALELLRSDLAERMPTPAVARVGRGAVDPHLRT
jgi:hypothetical protein